jgi:hypothetical protein
MSQQDLLLGLAARLLNKIGDERFAALVNGNPKGHGDHR